MCSRWVSVNRLALGYAAILLLSHNFLVTDVVLLGILLYARLGKLADGIAKLSERYWLRWHPSYQPVP